MQSRCSSEGSGRGIGARLLPAIQLRSGHDSDRVAPNIPVGASALPRKECEC